MTLNFSRLATQGIYPLLKVLLLSCLIHNYNFVYAADRPETCETRQSSTVPAGSSVEGCLDNKESFHPKTRPENPCKKTVHSEAFAIKYRSELSSLKDASSFRIRKWLEKVREKHGLCVAVELLINLSKERGLSPSEYSRFSYEVLPITHTIIRESGPHHFQMRVPAEKSKKYSNAPKGDPIEVTKGKSSVILTMLEPNEKPIVYGSTLNLSNLELALMSDEQLQGLIDEHKLDQIQKDLLKKQKKKVDHFYKTRVYFPIEIPRLTGGKTTLTATIPTTSYFQEQVLYTSETGRKDFQESLERPLKSLKDVEAAATEIAQSSDSSKILPNRSEIELMSYLLSQVAPGTVLGQNGPDHSTDANFLHIQQFPEDPEDPDHPLPLFSATTNGISQIKYSDNKKPLSITFSKVKHPEYPGTIYRVFSTSNDAKTRTFLNQLQDEFLTTDKNGSSLSLIARRTQDGYEYYFVLRKDILKHAEHNRVIAQQVLWKGDEMRSIPPVMNKRPGWLEYTGSFLQDYPEVYQHFTDAQAYQTLDHYRVDNKVQDQFEKIAKKAMVTGGDKFQ